MMYNITITNDTSQQAKSILMMLKSLALDYDFLKIEEMPDEQINEDEKQEIDRRLTRIENGEAKFLSWEEVKRDIKAVL